MSTWAKVSKLVDTVTGHDPAASQSVAKRRAAAKLLQEMVCKESTIRALAGEAGRASSAASAAASSSNRSSNGAVHKGKKRGAGDEYAHHASSGGGGRGGSRRPAFRVARMKALRSMWRTIVGAFSVFVSDVYQGKAKLAAGDIDVLYRVIVAFSTAKDGFDNNSEYSSLTLAKKATRNILTLCLDLLDDKDVLKIAEARLVELLAVICGSTDFVSNFRATDMQIVMEEVEKRIGAQAVDVDIVSAGTLGETAKIFESLARRASELGMSMNLIMPGAVKLVAGWCVGNIKGGSIRVNTSFVRAIMSGVTALIRSNPEQAVASVTRHGQPILKFVRRQYTSGDVAHRHALNEYVLCHM